MTLPALPLRVILIPPSRSFLGALGMIVVALPALGQNTFVVNSTEHPGDGNCDTDNCTLAEAIDAGNETAGVDTVVFDIPGDGPHTIQPASALPDIESPLVIDGFSQAGAAKASDEESAVLQIEIDGQSAPGNAHGISILGDHTIVRGLVINRFPRGGIYIEGSQNEVLGCHIGTNVAGTEALGNGAGSDDDFLYDGVWINDGFGNRVGRLNEVDRNVISGNANAGVWIDSPDGTNSVAGNYVGTNANGSQALPNSFGVVLQNSPNNVVSFNTISGNSEFGIVIADFEDTPGNATSNNVVGNLVGTDASGKKPVPNELDGILLNAADNTVGGPGGERNIVSANGDEERGGNGIVAVDPVGTVSASGNRILGNYVGLGAGGDPALGNASHGIVIEASNVLVGGTEEGHGNVISTNVFAGVSIAQGEGDPVGSNTVQGNLIGTDVTGSQALGNGHDAVSISFSAGNVIGGGSPGAGNVLAASAFAGIFIRGEESTDNLVMGNWIGTNEEGAELGNLDAGIDILEAQNTTIGGTAEGESNVIRHNSLAGVNVTNERPTGRRVPKSQTRLQSVSARGGAFVTVTHPEPRTPRAAGTANHEPVYASPDLSGSVSSGLRARTSIAGNGNAIVGNVISDNGGPPIDLSQDGDTPNDPDDPDEGPNRLMNHPEIASAKWDGTDLAVTVRTPTAPANATYPIVVHFYLNEDSGEAGSETAGDLSVYVGSAAISEQDANLEIQISFQPRSEVPAGARLLATSTDAEGNTSEGSDAVEISGTGVAVETDAIRTAGFSLSQNYPNPFHPETIIGVDVPRSAYVRLAVYDLFGRELDVLVDGRKAAGTYTYTYDAGRLASGMYVYRLHADRKYVQARTMLVTR